MCQDDDRKSRRYISKEGFTCKGDETSCERKEGGTGNLEGGYTRVKLTDCRRCRKANKIERKSINLKKENLESTNKSKRKVSNFEAKKYFFDNHLFKWGKI